MPRLIVNFGAQRNQVFELQRGEILVGREKDAGLQLSNVSVSRRHAMIEVDATGATLRDLESGNGTLVNGKPIESHRLASQDEVRIGKFTLVYLTDQRADQFHKGRCVKYMPAYTPRAAEPEHVDTFLLSKDALKAMQAQSRLVEDARLVLERDKARFWHPEDKKLTFGTGEAHIHPRGWYVFGDVAEIAWDGAKHVLKPLAFWVPVTVNDERVNAARPLRAGDRVRVAASRFVYEV